MEVGGCHSEFFFGGKSSQNSPKPLLIFFSIPCVFCLHTLLQVVGYYDLSVLSMSVMGFQTEKVFLLNPSFFGDFWNFLTLQSPLDSFY